MPQSRSFRTQALILKRRDFGEADRLLTLLTPHNGKLSVVAKGARKPTSKKTGHVELFTRADVLIARGRDLGILVQAEMVEPYLRLREDLGRGAYAGYAAELMDRFVNEGEDDLLQIFRLLDATLARLCNDPDSRLIIRYYEMQLLDLMGYRPELQECVITRDMILPEDQYFSFAEGGVVSPEAAPHTTGLIPLPMKTLKVLRHLQRSTYKRVQSLKLDPARHQDLERVMLGYIMYLLESKLQSVDFIRRIRRGPGI